MEFRGNEVTAKELQQRFTWSRILVPALIVVLLAAVIVAGVRQSETKAIHDPNDFVTLYAGSICMTDTCNPYSVPQLDSVLVARRGTSVRQVWSDQLPIYPPTTLVLLLPFSLLSYKAATVMWYVLSLAVYVFALCWVCFRSRLLEVTPLVARCAFALLGLHFPKMLQCLGFGNPSVMVTGLLLFAVFDARANRWLLHVGMGLLACMLKPPMAIPVAAIMLIKEAQNIREALKTAGICAAIFGAIAICSFVPKGMAHWQSDLKANIALGEQGGMNPSNRVSPSNVLLNVANIPGYFTRNHHVIGGFVAISVVPLIALFVFALWRSSRGVRLDDRAYLAAVAACAALTLLPVYHRFCDVGILLLVGPWLIREFAHGARWQAWIATPMLGALYFSWERRIHLEKITGAALAPVEFLYYRGDAILVLLLACVLVSAMLRCVHSPRRAEPTGTGA